MSPGRGVGREERIVIEEPLEELGPIDYVVLEWQGQRPDTGEVQPLLLDLVDRGIVRILDIAFVTKDENGSVSALDVGDLDQMAAAFAAFEGASSGLLGFDDLQEAAAALEPGTSAAVLVWENRWRRRWPRPCAAPAASWWPAAGSRCRPSWPPSTSSRPPTSCKGATHARTASCRRPHRRGRGNGHRGQQPCLAPPGRALAATGDLPYGQQEPAYQEPAPQCEEPPPQPQQDMVQQLKDLAELKDQGILTEEEFAAQKARILGS
jgi:hypothetical protein